MQDMLAEFLKYPPKPFHLIVISRRDPHLPLATMRAKGQMTKIRTKDLRFSIEETGEQFLKLSLEHNLVASTSYARYFLSSQQSVVSLVDAVDASKRSVNLSLLQYSEGIVDYQRVIDSQRFLTQQQDTLVLASGGVGLNLIAMYKALGGGWQIRDGKAMVSDDI